MSTIRSTADGGSAIADVDPRANDFGPDEVAPDAMRRKSEDRGFTSRFIPVLRRPPALLLEVGTGSQDASFDSLIETHVIRAKKISAGNMAYSLADFMLRRLPELEERRISPAAEDGLNNLTDTVKMFEHIYIAQSADGA